MNDPIESLIIDIAMRMYYTPSGTPEEYEASMVEKKKHWDGTGNSLKSIYYISPSTIGIYRERAERILEYIARSGLLSKEYQ